ncbi:MAG TPA: hydroxysqualene dehydroxylase HpnE [Gaiellaceae bacterium]|nr:hydroxysqualene dehydroxylase HpnE [Gaiellaceae bacterium]
MNRARIAVLGGGLAGITAALECADAGAEVTLYEARPRLGGATFSIRRGGHWLDNGQHVALRCCTAYRRLLVTLGTDRYLELQPRLSILVLDGAGNRATFGRTALPAPLHLAKALLSYRHLTLRERAAAARAVTALRRLDPADPRLDETTFGAWLRAHGQSREAIDRLWDLIALPTLNLHADDASLALAAFVFRTGVLDESDACDIGVPTVPLQRLHGEAAAAALRARGVRIRLRTKVERVHSAGEGFELQLRDGPERVDRVVSAVPPQVAAELLPPGIVSAEEAERLGTSPIVNVHLHYDRRVLDVPFAAAVGSPVQWLFDRTASSEVEHGQFLSLSLSGADEELTLTRARLVERSAKAIARMLPAAREAQLLDSAVTREPAATFRGSPGSARLRPPARTDLPGLALAGAWTDTGWPATMEGAVRSGSAAAAQVLSQPLFRRRLEEVA